MGGFNPPVPQQDNNWEIRVAVLLSLLFQVLIVFLGPMRKRSSSPVVRFAIWSSYLLADWVADLALGLLLNNMGNIGGNSSQHASDFKHGPAAAPDSSSSSPIIFAFWTPFLLVHLGGQDSLTALSIQDNDLWLRNLTSLGFQLFTACVIFFCSLEGNPMMPGTVLIFVVGIIKYGERIYSLYSGSVDGVLAHIIGDPDPGPNYAKFMTAYNSKEQAGLPVELVIVDIQAQREQLRGSMMLKEQKNIIGGEAEKQAYKFFRIFRKLCFDVKPSNRERMISQAYFRERADVTDSPAKAFKVIELELNFIYDMLHTKEPIAHTKAGCVLRFVSSTCIVSALLIFLFHHKGGITRVDVAITYALLLGGVSLDAAALTMLLVSNWTLVFLEETPLLAWLAGAVRTFRPEQRRWREDTSQLNLISYCLGIPQPRRVVRTLAMVAEKLHVREIFHDLFFIRRKPLSSSVVQGEDPFLFKVVFDVLKVTANMEKTSSYHGEGALEDEELLGQIMEILKPATRQAARKEEDYAVIQNKVDEKLAVLKEMAKMKQTSSYRGEGVLLDLHDQIMENLKKATREAAWEEEDGVISNKAKEKLDVLVGSVRREFAESLLMWHIATDLCCHPLGDTVPTERASKMRSISVDLSEYMLYLLIKQPKILLASAGIGLKQYQDTCAEAKRFIKSAAVWDPNHVDVRRMLLSVNTTTGPSAVKGDVSKSVLFDGVILAKALRVLGDELMWEVVARVWGEMLTYAAGKCKGSTHVQQLSRGGELITMVWFLMAHMGLSDVYKDKEDVEFASKLIVHK